MLGADRVRELENVKIRIFIYFLALYCISTVFLLYFIYIYILSLYILFSISTVFFPSLLFLSLNITSKVRLPDCFIEVREWIRPWPADWLTRLHFLSFVACAVMYFRYTSNFQSPYDPNWHCQRSMLVRKPEKEAILQLT